MKSIWKYPIPIGERADEFDLKVPDGAVPVYFDMQDGVTTVWCIVNTDPTWPTGSIHLRLLGSGHHIEGNHHWRYVGSCQDSPFVWHLLWDPMG